MKLDPDKFIEDENRSNHMVTAMKHKDCPINEICFFTALGDLVNTCTYLSEDEENINCIYIKFIPEKDEPEMPKLRSRKIVSSNPTRSFSWQWY
jgi:hypothetical protein